MTILKPVMTANDVMQFLKHEFPQSKNLTQSISIERLEPGEVSIAFEATDDHLRPGGTVSGPTLFWLSDLGGYICILSHIGPEALAVTTNININFMRKAAPGVLVTRARILKLGKKLMVFDVEICTRGTSDIIAHATGTYAIPSSARTE